MIAVRALSKEEVEQRLWRLKCKKVREYQDNALWKTQTGHYFTVPQMGPDGRCSETDLNLIIEDIKPYLPPDMT